MGANQSATLTRSDYYRETAKSLRDRAAGVKFPESREELCALAAEYERLAEFTEDQPFEASIPDQPDFTPD